MSPSGNRRGKAVVGVGIVGNGMATRVFHAPYIVACPDLQLRAVVSRRVDAEPPLSGIALVPDIETLLDDDAIDLVVIATPTATHAELALQALEAGKHVLVDKPFALDLAAARQVLEKAAEKGLIATAFHNRRYDADYLAVKAALENGELGRVVHFESHFDRFRPEVRDRWREDGSIGSGIWYDLGPHLVDQAVDLFGRPDAISSDIACLREGGRSPDYAHVILHYAQCRVILHASMCAAAPQSRFCIHGTKGSICVGGLDPQEAQSIAGLRPGDPHWGMSDERLTSFDSEGVACERSLPRGCQQVFYERLAAACLGRGQVPVTSEEVLLVQEVVEAAQRASHSGRRQDF